MAKAASQVSVEDPLNAVADALEAAAVAVRDGVDEAATGTSTAASTIGGVLSDWTYRASYAVSYGVVFPTMLMVKVIPKDNPIVHGFTDGAKAALDFVDEVRSKGDATPEG